MSYKDRCYNHYVSTHMNYTQTSSVEEYNFFAKISTKRFREFLPNNKKAKIIDVACGAGHFLYFLQKEGYKNTRGIDLSEEQLEVAKKMKVKNVRMADLFTYLPKHPQSFDMIIARDIIEHLKKDEVIELLNLVYQALKLGGKVLIGTPNAQSLFGASTTFIDFTHEQGFTPQSLSQILRVGNFEDVMVYGEKSIIHDFRSAIRAGLWWCIEKTIKLYIIIERGTGRGLWKRYDIFEPRMFAIAKKPQKI
jgi:2-polyprenyl-3-methyl-5-hydroxy-6-metoxy-1,4-benzoquinol methylase